MKCSLLALVAACAVALTLLGSGASAQRLHTHEHDHPDVVLERRDFGPVRRATGPDSTQEAGSAGIIATPDNQILVELLPRDTASANLFDLTGRTLLFTPDRHGGYSRSVRSVAWDDDIGRAVADGEEIRLQSFLFDFAGQSWSSFFVSARGVITFRERLTYSHHDAENRPGTMREVASRFVTTPTISALYKPYLGGWVSDEWTEAYGATQHVSSSPDRVVVTWTTTEPVKYVHGLPPDAPSRFQVVLRADGSVTFNYQNDVFFGDGIVGLFPHEDPTKSALITSIVDPSNPELAGHLDLIEVAIWESSTGGAIVEWTTRGDIPAPRSGTRYSYRLHLDAEEPYFDEDGDSEFEFQIDLEGDAARTRGGTLLPKEAGNRIALLVENPDLFGISAHGRAAAVQVENGRVVSYDQLQPTPIELPVMPPAVVDLSRSDSVFSRRQIEVFHHRSAPDFADIACRVIDTLGDEFDFFVFHVEFAMDSQEHGASNFFYHDENVSGIGISGRSPPCGEGRLKAGYPDWVKSTNVFNARERDPKWTGFEAGLLVFAHEITHMWTAYASYQRNGEREPLSGNYCGCHWLAELHTPAAFPWNPASPGPGGFMNDLVEGTGRLGGFWRENGDGTFTLITDYWSGGHSWLDLYMMGLAEAHEVPDMFILRNLEPVAGTDRYTGEREVVTIEQVVAAEGPREPPPARAQKVFNVGFVYVTAPGQTPDLELLALQRELRGKIVEHWSHVTGGRSRMTATVPRAGNRAPMAVGTLRDQAMGLDSVAVVDVGSAFRDPDGDPLTYKATSSAPAVAAVAASASTVTVRAVAVGTATVTVTATDAAGSNTSAALAFRVTVRARAAFTDDPIVPGVTPIKAVHFTELRERIDLLRTATGLEPFSWTDPVLTAGVTPVRLIHLLQLRQALTAAYTASGRPGPTYTDPAPTPGMTTIRAAHLTEVRDAVSALQ